MKLPRPERSGTAAARTRCEFGRSLLDGGAGAANRWNRGAWIFRDETLQRIEILLDEAFRVPGTQIRFGLDGIIGLVPGLGDVLAGTAIADHSAGRVDSRRAIRDARADGGEPRHRRAGRNGSALRRHFRHLVEGEPPQLSAADRHLGEPRRHTWRDWCFLVLLGAVMAVVFALPVVLVVWANRVAAAPMKACAGRRRSESNSGYNRKRLSGRSAVW